MQFFVIIYQKNSGKAFPVEVHRFETYHEAAEFSWEFNEKNKNKFFSAYVGNI